MKNKCTLCCDYNWLIISRFSVINKGFDKSLPAEALEAAKEELKDMLAKSINVILNRFPIIDNIVLMADGGSWRKQLPIPKQLEDITYKGNRKSDVELDWNYIWGASSEVLENCKKEGITVSQHNGIEGDDWAWYWSRRLNSEGTNVIIWSSDCDLKQLVQVDKTGAFTVWYNDKNGMWIPKELEPKTETDVLDFFMQPVYYNPTLESLKSNAKGSINYIDPNTIVLGKVICGDAGDNIKSVVRYVKNGRTYRFSEKDWGSVCKSLNINTVQEMINNKSSIADAVCKHKKLKSYDIKSSDVLEMIDYNIKLVWLNEAIIPETAILAMNNIKYKDYDLSYIRANYKIICGNKDENEIINIFNSI